jgi:branched-chain amino acid transport system substrate-binding protein
MNKQPFHRAGLKISIPSLVILVILMVEACAVSPSFSCTDPIGCVDIKPGEPIKLGALFTLSGGSSPGGTEQARAVELSLSLRKNQLLNHPITLQTEDEHCSPEGGANGALRLVADPQMVAIFGTNCSSAAITAGKIMSDKGLVMISGSNTSPVLTSVNGIKGNSWVPGYFRTAWNDSSMGLAAANFASQKLNISRAVVINAGDAYTKGLTDAFSQNFTNRGGQILLSITIDEADPNQVPTLKAIAQSKPQMVFAPISSPETGARIVKQAKEVDGLDKVIFVMGEGMLSDVFIHQAESAALGIYILGPSTPSGTTSNQLRQAYMTKYGEPPPSFYYTLTYDAVNLILDTIEKVAVQEKDDTLHIGRQALRNALYAAKDYNGMTGHLTCDAFGDCGVAKMDIYRLDDLAAGIEGLRSNVIFSFSSQ